MTLEEEAELDKDLRAWLRKLEAEVVEDKAVLKRLRKRVTANQILLNALKGTPEQDDFQI